ncbi:hypothetical protein HOU00_gp264 [Caulobacter phage CcrPW]|uniref:Uncharacterized protein n=1 Tax=Caulobacter phage CcrPW TaxID=2283271 RepID=A0A385EAF3_9CAUD|nr:hypothetical protein HOU00_gp264 [Caulobacter phage CcrPW]AXQ68861.1 hypothetical protein CcrPW_gp322 [Caulobacter phage CcrPW]
MSLRQIIDWFLEIQDDYLFDESLGHPSYDELRAIGLGAGLSDAIAAQHIFPFLRQNQDFIRAKLPAYRNAPLPKVGLLTRILFSDRLLWVLLIVGITLCLYTDALDGKINGIMG